MVDSLQNMCIYYMKCSEISENYALAVEPGYIARQIFITQAGDVPVIFIHTRCTLIDGNFQRGVTCGFHVSRKSFLLGVFEGCVCQDPRTLVQWHSEINSKGMSYNTYIENVSLFRSRLYFLNKRERIANEARARRLQSSRAYFRARPSIWENRAIERFEV